MTSRTLIFRSLRFHARSHLGVLLGAAVGSAVLVGALVVGDSVRESLRQRALKRLGPINMALDAKDRMFREDLVKRLLRWASNHPRAGNTNALYSGRMVAVTKLNAIATTANGAARARHVNLFASTTGFVMPFDFVATNLEKYVDGDGNELFVNRSLADQLRITTRDEVLFRMQKPGMLSGEVTVAPRNENKATLRMTVDEVAAATGLGDFSLVPGMAAPFNAFITRATLDEKIVPHGHANLILAEFNCYEPLRINSPTLRKVISRLYSIFPSARGILEPQKQASVHEMQAALGEVWQLGDLQTDLAPADSGRSLELRTGRVFLDPPIVHAALAADTNAQPILTYLVNLLRSGTNTTPYSMVTAAGPPWTPADMRDDEILVSQWLADDLQAKPGDEISLTCFDPESGARLVERTNTFRVRSVVPMEMPWADRTLMPDFPGIEKAESTHDWDAGFPLVHKIRQKDEDYWKQYRGTPKAFVTLTAGQKMWGNRFGNLTAIRFPIPTNATTLVEQPLQGRAGSPLPAAGTNTIDGARGVTVTTTTAEAYRAALERKILSTLKPEEVGLRFEPVREQALRAAEQSQDFGQLFLGFSFFLIVAALLLMALLFQFGLEQRTAEIGTLLALGFPPRQVRRLLLLEGCVLALIGGAIGALAGTIYAKAMLRGLTTIWRDAVGTSALHYYARPTTLVIGLLASTLIAALTIWLALRKQGQRPARELLEEGAEEKFQVGRSRAGLVGAVATASAAALVVWAIWKGETSAAEIFFSAGALLLIAGLGFCAAWFARLARKTASTSRLTIGDLGLRGCSRRRKRSLATVALLACGTFLVAAIGVFRLDANLDATKRTSGTGGFALIGDSTLPVVQDLNSKSGRDFFGLDSDKLAGVEFVPFRVRDGDDASCLNLNRAQKPRLLGVKPESVAERFTFAKGEGWTSLKPEIRNPKSEVEVPAIGDANSIQWALGKKVGDTLDYTDERGQTFKVRIVGAVANSILQGSLIIDEAEFIKRFPSESGYRMFLIDSPTNRTTEVSATLSRALQDVGLELQPTAQKLAAFNAVQNTYLSTFQILGGLGLLLGSAGLGVVVLRNVLERRGELALLLAVGFQARMLRWLVLSEHGALLWLGLGVGVIAAIVAVLPSLLSPGAEIPYLSLALTLAAVLVNGMIWTWLATRFALRGKLLDALRNE